MPAGGADDEVHYFFIKRPVLAIVISVIITLLGVFAIRLLPISRYPQITPPAVQVQAVFPGATAEDVAEAVAAPIEAQLSGLQGLLYYSSANASDGTMSLQIYFDVNRSQDLAAVDVQNAVKLAEPQLPDAVRQNGITILKANTDILGVVALTSDDPRYDAAYLTNYMKLYVEDEIKRMPGIGNALTFGGLEFSMLIQLDPDRMAQLGITTGDVAGRGAGAERHQPGGPAGTRARPRRAPSSLAGNHAGPAQDAGAVRRHRGPGQGGRLHRSDPRHRQGRPGLSQLRSGGPAERHAGGPDAAVSPRPAPTRWRPRRRWSSGWTSCPTASRRACTTRSRSTPRRSSPPPFTKWWTTLLEAMALVTLVVFIFLQSWRATLIPMLAVPVSVIGTFLGPAGARLHHQRADPVRAGAGDRHRGGRRDRRHREHRAAHGRRGTACRARLAADRAIRQVAGALIAIVLALCAVFVPVAFLGGVTGEMFKQFAVTLVIAVRALRHRGADAHACALRDAPQGLQRGQHHAASSAGSTGGSTASPTATSNGVGRVLGRPRLWLAAFVVMVARGDHALEARAHRVHPDRGQGLLRHRDAAARRGVAAAHQGGDPAGRRIPPRGAGGGERGGVCRLDVLTRTNQTNSATIFILLKPWDERGKDESIDAITKRINGKLFGMKDAVGFAFNLPEIPGLGATSGVEVNLQNRSGKDVRDFAQKVQAFQAAVNQLPAVQAMTTNFRANVPQVYLDVDRATAKSRGVNLTELFSTLQTFLSHALHQRLQPLRPDLPGAGGGAAAVPPDAGGHRPAVRPGPQSAR